MWNYQVSHFEVCPDPGKERGKTSAASKPFVVTLEIQLVMMMMMMTMIKVENPAWCLVVIKLVSI